MGCFIPKQRGHIRFGWGLISRNGSPSHVPTSPDLGRGAVQFCIETKRLMGFQNRVEWKHVLFVCLLGLKKIMAKIGMARKWPEGFS